jgi:hypothetical protein
MALADDLMTSAQRFYALARVASNTTTKLQLVCLADDYFRQANEMRQISSLRFAQARTSQMQSGRPRAVLGGFFEDLKGDKRVAETPDAYATRTVKGSP